MMETYTLKEMLVEAQKAGATGEKTMWASIERVSDLLTEIKREHPETEDLYWRGMRELHGVLYGNHYNEAFARYDVDGIRYKGRDGERMSGPKWTPQEVELATKGFTFPAGVTKWDKYVAFNAMYSDLCQDLTDEQILKVAHRFFFADEDWGDQTKVWEYFLLKSEQ